MITKIIQKRVEHIIIRNVITKAFLVGLVLFLVKSPVLGQETDVRCEVSGLDFNLSQHDPEYLINFGSFSVFADGKKEKGGAMIARFYKLPRTNMILSVSVAYGTKNGPFGNQVIAQQMILGRKRFPTTSPKFDEGKMAKYIVSMALMAYPIKAFDEGGKGNLYTAFLGKKNPVAIMMTCKKTGS